MTKTHQKQASLKTTSSIMTQFAALDIQYNNILDTEVLK